MRFNRYLRESLDIAACQEEEKIHVRSGAFTAYQSKQYKKCFLILTAVILAIGMLSTGAGILSFREGETAIEGVVCSATLFLGLTLLGLSYIPTLFSYCCYVDNELLREEYLVLFLKKKKTILWSEVEYIKIEKDAFDNIRSVCFFDSNKKRLLYLSSSVVGLTKIAEKAKRKRIRPYYK